MNSENPTPLYLNYTSIKLPLININDISIKKDNRDILYSKLENKDYTEIIIDFNGVLLYNNTPEIYTISFNTFFETNNDLLELKLLGDFSNDIKLNSVSLIYNNNVGDIQYSSSEYEVDITQFNRKIINFKSVNSSLINVTLGESLVYEFFIEDSFINYDNNIAKNIDINLPLYTENQFVLFTQIDPLPEYAFKDDFGNLFARYSISPNSELSIKITGYILNNKGVSNYYAEKLFDENIIDYSYWDIIESNQKSLIKLSVNNSTNTNILVSNILNYILLTYDPIKDEDTLQINKDLSSSILSNKINSKEYANISVLLLRMFNIHAREVVGYIDTGNDIVPHTWVEYYDNNKWNVFDPYLIEYNSNITLNRFSLVHRYVNDFSPEFKYTSFNNIKIVKISKDIEITSLIKFEYVDNDILIKNIGNTIITRVENENSSLLRYNEIILPDYSVNIYKSVENSDGKFSYFLYNIEYEDSYNGLKEYYNNSYLRYFKILFIIPLYTLIFFTFYFIINMKKTRSFLKLIKIFAIFIIPIFYINNTYAQEISNTYEPFDIYVNVGSQSIFTKKVPVTITIIPKINSEETQIKWDTPVGVIIEEKYENFFDANIDNSYTAKAYIIPEYKGDYDITVSVNSWRINSNLSSSENIQITFDNNLFVTPIQGGTIVQVFVFIVGIFSIIFLIIFLLKKYSPILIQRLKKWLKPPEY